jgi:RNA polymerase sigma-70 factor (ECF subfamily)
MFVYELSNNATKKLNLLIHKRKNIMENALFQANLMSIQGNMLNFAYMLTANRDDAYDLLQDTTLKVLDNADKYVDNVNFKGWVFTIMRNIFINNYRRIVRTATVIDRTEDLFHLNLPQNSGFDTPEGTISVIEITAVINSFTDEYRIPFSMHVAGYKYAEIAEEMQLPLGTVKSRIFFARQRLQKLLHCYQ